MMKMNKNDIKNKLESVINNSQYVRVSDEHPLELYLGKNEKGYLTLRYNGNFTPVKIVGNGMLEIKQVKTSSYNSLLFCYTSQKNVSLFYNFCEDIITQTEDFSGSDGYLEIVNRYTQWKKMFFGSNKLLSEVEVQGLIGELLFLKNSVFPVFGTTEGLNGWSGPEPTHKDFSYKNKWFEVKTINSFRNTVHISSLEQLDSDIDGRLVVYSLEKMSPSFNGISLNKLVLEITNSLYFENDKDIFLEKLKQVGYAYNDFYDSFVYNLIGKDTFVVSCDFPRIKRDSLPLGIGKVEYEIELTQIEKYKED